DQNSRLITPSLDNLSRIWISGENRRANWLADRLSSLYDRPQVVALARPWAPRHLYSCTASLSLVHGLRDICTTLRHP
ncbi:hypothetical protein ACFL17_06760, partial [Pseudomonadota bacterium]